MKESMAPTVTATVTSTVTVAAYNFRIRNEAKPNAGAVPTIGGPGWLLWGFSSFFNFGVWYDSTIPMTMILLP